MKLRYFIFQNLTWLILLVILCPYTVYNQAVGIGTSSPNNTSALDIQSTNKGLLIPRMTASQRNAINSPANGLMVYDTDFSSFWYYGTGQWLEVGTSYALKSVNGPTNFTAIPLNPRRYIWEMNSSHPLQTTMEIPLFIISDLCGDDDGCNITLTMSNWGTPPAGTAAISTSFKFFYNATTNVWRVNDGTVFAGTDGNNNPENVGILQNFIYFTDGAYMGPAGNDSAIGFGLMKWTGFPSTTVGRLIMED